MTAPKFSTATLFLVATTGVSISQGLAIAALRLRRAPPGRRADLPRSPARQPGAPAVRRVDNFATDTLRSTFELNYPHCEILFCVASAKDPVIPLIETLMAEQPAADARLLVGADERVSNNPKLN